MPKKKLMDFVIKPTEHAITKFNNIKNNTKNIKTLLTFINGKIKDKKKRIYIMLTFAADEKKIVFLIPIEAKKLPNQKKNGRQPALIIKAQKRYKEELKILSNPFNKLNFKKL